MFKNALRKITATKAIRLAITALSLTILAGYFLNRQSGTYQDEISLVTQLTGLIFVYSLLMRHLMRPLKRIFAVSEKIYHGDLTQRFADDNTSYFRILTTSNNQLLQRIEYATDFIKNIEQGNLEVEYQALEGEEAGKDSLSASLLSMREQMRTIEEQNRERNWKTQGLAKFGEILRSNNEKIEVLSDNILTHLCEYLDANQAALFIVRDLEIKDKEEAELEMIACYAYNRKKYLNKTVKAGQGLAGQTFLEQETTYITEVPQDYVNITSGLGKSTPRSVILVPLKINEEVFGILEMASFNEFEQYQIDFMEKLSESIASTISSAKANERTKSLLNESQQQTEQLRAQEEEMRQNMEELQATQEQQERTRQELNQKVEELERTKARFEAKEQEMEQKFKDSE